MSFRSALVTGASSGIGRAIALELARPGVRLWLAARRAAELERVAEEARVRGAQAEAVILDVRDAPAVHAAVRAADERAGGLELVLANAGVGRSRPLRAFAWEELAAVLEVNVVGAIATLWAAAGPMAARGRGTLAATSSVAALRGLPGSGAYSASKAALSTFLETLRADLADSGVAVCDLRPGFVRTPLTAGNRFPMPFLLEAEDAARRMVRALERGRPVTTFPLGLALPMGLVHHLPGFLWRPLARRLARRVP